MKYLAIDFETANARRSSICAFGYAFFENSRLIESGVDLCRPEPNYYNSFNTAIHGISKKDTDHLHDFSNLIAKFDDFSPDFLVAHNASFDMSCLRQWCAVSAVPHPKFPYICTLVISRVLHPELNSHKLNRMCELYDIPLNHHEAESDAVACGLLLVKYADQFQASSLENICAGLGIDHGHLFMNQYKPCSCKKSRKFT